jgi:single-strand DNA-binding protein
VPSGSNRYPTSVALLRMAPAASDIAGGRSISDGEKKEETDYHCIVAWGKLGEICSQYLKKGRLVYVEGRLHSRQFTDNEGITKSATEIVIDDMQMLDKKPQEEEANAQTNGQQAATTS